jgi:hypothetical protein
METSDILLLVLRFLWKHPREASLPRRTLSLILSEKFRQKNLENFFFRAKMANMLRKLGFLSQFGAGLPDGVYISKSKLPIWVNFLRFGN